MNSQFQNYLREGMLNNCVSIVDNTMRDLLNAVST